MRRYFCPDPSALGFHFALITCESALLPPSPAERCAESCRQRRHQRIHLLQVLTLTDHKGPTLQIMLSVSLKKINVPKLLYSRIIFCDGAFSFLFKSHLYFFLFLWWVVRIMWQLNGSKSTGHSAHCLTFGSLLLSNNMGWGGLTFLFLLSELHFKVLSGHEGWMADMDVRPEKIWAS